MYYLARKFWGPAGAVVSALLYIYAPYRAVDVWVRGALPEALAFVLFPVIFYHFDKLCQHVNKRNFFWLTVSAAALITTHNLSALMLTPFLGLWWLYRWWQTRSVSSLIPLAFAAVLAGLLSAYYLLPVVAESKYITLAQTTQGYYDYRAHFTTLNQLFISNFWGYGGSTWGPNDTMSFAVGYSHWILPLVLLLPVLIWPKLNRVRGLFIVCLVLGWLAVLLTHNKSAFIWTHISPMAYIQFPWRFLTLATLFFSLASGAIAQLSSRRVIIGALLVLVVILNYSFYRPDIWRAVSDAQQFSGSLWDEQRASALPDYWPVFGQQMPTSYALTQPRILLRTSNYIKVQYPIVYFPGWRAWVDKRPLNVFPEGKLGLITIRVPVPYSKIELKLTNTFPRTLGNYLSLVSLLGLIVWYLSKRWQFSS